MKPKLATIRMLIELPVEIHRIFKEESKFRNMTLKRLMMEAFIQKLQRDHSESVDDRIVIKRGYENGVVYKRVVLVIPTDIHAVIKAESAWRHITLKEYITTALIEKMKHDSQYRLNPLKPGGAHNESRMGNSS